MSVTDYEELRRRAEAFLPDPAAYRLEMEDDTPKGEERERSYVWEPLDGTAEERIEVSFELNTGRLLSLDRACRSCGDAAAGQPASQAAVIPAAEDFIQAAEMFLSRYAPDERGEWNGVNCRPGRRSHTVSYRQEVGELPLPYTGCTLTLDMGLHVVRYRAERYAGSPLPTPELPMEIAEEQRVRQRVLDELQMELKITCLYPSLYEMAGAEEKYRLVYEPRPSRRWLDAVTGEDLFPMSHYVLPPSRPLAPAAARPPLNQPTTEPPIEAADLTAWEKRLGIDLDLYILEKSKEDEEQITALYRLKDETESEPAGGPLSVDAYMKRKWGEKLRQMMASYMLQVEKETGRLVRYHHSGCGSEGAGQLSRPQCWEHAEAFLRHVFPDYTAYLQIEVDGEDAGDQVDREFFFLPVHIKGIPVNHERVTIVVSTSTGEICSYSGVSYAMIRELETADLVPVLTAAQALVQFKASVRLQLRWSVDREPEPRRYTLEYAMTTTAEGVQEHEPHRRELRFIDAHTGELIWSKENGLS